MKKILLIFPLLVITAFAQQKVNKGFYSIGGTVLIKNDNSTAGAMINVGYEVSKFVTLGGGAEFYKFKGVKTPYVPLYAHLKIYFNEKVMRPYVTIAPGYGIFNRPVPGPVDNPATVKGGGFIAASLGVHFRSLKKNAYIGPYLQAGIKHLTFETSGLPGDPGIKTQSDFISIDFGFRF